ncbi:MAG: hypothetical protein JNN12_16810 [Bacteroidetes Order II. Incertae sedis bacterium]|nr:hypothetical protein [Bacteroidetes Order II. bacterium]
MRSVFLRYLLVPVALLMVGQVRAQGVVDRNHVPSKERVDDLQRRKDVVDGNNLRATITNFLQTAQSGEPGDIFYEWPKNTNRIYVALSQMWVGAEVAATDGKPLYIVDVANFRNNLNNGTNSWNFRPIKGYVNPAGRAFGIAQSDEPNSWPATWPDKANDTTDPGWRGSWNGLFGKDIFNADQEFFYKAGDDQYDRYPNFFPDDTDRTRKGLGLVVDARVLAWSQILIQDVVFLLHGIKNDGSKDLNKVGVSIWLADLVGGDASDDIPFFDLAEDVAFMTDADGIGTEPFGSEKVGVAAIAFLETPGNSVDRIDNDGDGSTNDCDITTGECSSPIVTDAMIATEDPTNGIDDNGNGLIDENRAHIAFTDAQASSRGVGYADFVDNDGDGEQDSPVVTPEMVAASSSDKWLRWPPNPENDAFLTTITPRPTHLLMIEQDDVGKGFKDGIDNDNSAGDPKGKTRYACEEYLSEPGSPLVTQAMIDAAKNDPYGRYRVPGTNIILYQVGPEDLGKPYADGVDNDKDGAIDEGIDEMIDEMIDESRSDGLDNDCDWDPLRDDTGLDGVQFTGDTGDGDRSPTTGAGTAFPGEKNIDVTDVSESDQIGLTNVKIIPAFTLDFNRQSDQELFNKYMKPGELDTQKPPPGENDLVVSSGIFPLKAGQTERISLSIQVGSDRTNVLRKRDNAYQAYAEDYQFAQAPAVPALTAVPGDKSVTLYWDSAAEESVDQFLLGLGLPAKDFEGYRIYRATDPAFLDALKITDGYGNLSYKKPIAQFDLKNGVNGFHPVDVNGVKFYLGNDSGLVHKFVDTTVENGITYYYAITSYDFGAATANISPTEAPVRIRRLPDGTIETAKNVVKITPGPTAAGYTPATFIGTAPIVRTKGLTSSKIDYSIIDPTVIKNNNKYRITFRDTLIVSPNPNLPDTLTTKSWSLYDVTGGKFLLEKQSAGLKTGTEFPLFDAAGNALGFRLIFQNEPFVSLNSAESFWKNSSGAANNEVYPITFEPYVGGTFVRGLRNPADYRIKIVEPGQGQSVQLKVRTNVTLPARKTNFQVYRLEPDGAGGVREVPIEYGFWDLTGPEAENPAIPGVFSNDTTFGESDFIIFYEPKVGDTSGQKIITWRVGLNFTFKDRKNPATGDNITLNLRKPLLSSDEFEFTTEASKIDTEKATSALDKIKVVPNPYVATNRFEPLNPFSTGRGPRVIKFMNLPANCTIRIYTVSGRLVKTLNRDYGANITSRDMLDGALEWDLQSEDGLSVAYGIYVYHVEAPGLGESTGTFAIIK